MEIRCAVVGNIDAGKSTLLGVLTHGELDNGQGLARRGSGFSGINTRLKRAKQGEWKLNYL